MLQLPPVPTWESIHPLVIHFPIVLLLVSPVFVLIGTVLQPARAKGFMILAFALLAVGTASLFVAVETGEAAAELADRTPQINATLQAHESLASRSLITFSALSVLLFLMIALPRFLSLRLTRSESTIISIAFLALYSTGILALANTAHQGGRLVHEFGVHAIMPAQGTAQARN